MRRHHLYCVRVGIDAGMGLSAGVHFARKHDALSEAILCTHPSLAYRCILLIAPPPPLARTRRGFGGALEAVLISLSQ